MVALNGLALVKGVMGGQCVQMKALLITQLARRDCQTFRRTEIAKSEREQEIYGSVSLFSTVTSEGASGMTNPQEQPQWEL